MSEDVNVVLHALDDSIEYLYWKLESYSDYSRADQARIEAKIAKRRDLYLRIRAGDFVNLAGG